MSDLACAEFEAQAVRHERLAGTATINLSAGGARVDSLRLVSASWAAVGFCRSNLREFDRACNAFLECSKYALDMLEIDQSPSSALTALEFAVLGKNSAALARLSEMAMPMESKQISPLLLSHVRAAQSLLRSDLAAATGAAEECQFLDGSADQWKYWHGIGQALLGAATANGEVLNTGLREIVRSHIQLATKGSRKGTLQTLVCVPACVIVSLAMRRGVPATIEEVPHNARLPFVVTALEVWEGKPAARTKFQAQADLVPLELLS